MSLFNFSSAPRNGFFAVFLLGSAFAFAEDFGDSPLRLPVYRVAESSRLSDHARPSQMSESITATRVAEAINVIDTEDALKYAPSIFLRKRNYGDTQPTMATRVWGVSSSARSLVYADGVVLSALVANNNSIGAPRWGMVAPAEIERVDVMHGPFAASYPGNSMGAVVEITTRMPERLEFSLEHTRAWQSFGLYGTRDTYATTQTNAAIGNRVGNFSFWLSGNFQESDSQPLSFVTAPTFPTGTTGGYEEKNKFSRPANVVGASGLLHTRMANAKLKFAYDFSPTLRAAYSFGFWSNDADSRVESYLRNAANEPTFAGLTGFASGRYELEQRHAMQSLSVKAAPVSDWEIEAAASLYSMVRDQQRFPTTANATRAEFGDTGRVASLDGTGWTTFDVKAIWRPDVADRAHTVTLGAHDDRYTLINPTFQTPEWRAGATTGVATEGNGKTHTQALWLQDAWQILPSLRITVGGRFEQWAAFDGYNANGAIAVHQPERGRSAFSPKATLTWTALSRWTFGASVGQAYRFATPAELYQLVSTGTTFTSPNSNLKPDAALSTEFKAEYVLPRARVRLSVFEDDVHDAIISQYRPLVENSPTQYQFLSNVDHVRAQGIELALQNLTCFHRSLEFSGSVTYVDARTLATQGRGQFGSAIGKRLPNIPDWRASFVATCRPSQSWSVTFAGRYSGMSFTTIDQSDVNPNTYQGFGSWFVADLRLQHHFNERWSVAIGADNLLNRKYFLFHPFPQRTGIVDLKYSF